MRDYLFVGALGAAILVTAPAAGQAPAQEPEDQEIIVSGHPVAERQVQDFVRALTGVRGAGQISRFEAALCPSVVGLTPEHNAAVIARMRTVARAAGIALGPNDCQPNVLVIAAPDKRAMIERLRTVRPGMFVNMTPRQVRRLARSAGPVAAWHVETEVDTDGRPHDTFDLPSTTGAAPPTPTQAGQGLGEAEVLAQMRADKGTVTFRASSTMGPSRLIPTSRPQFSGAVMVVETSVITGVTATQLADYAALRTFVRTDPEVLADSSVPTILRMFQQPTDQPLPVTMTHWDLGYLRALYASPENHFANSQRSDMQRRMISGFQQVQERGR